MSGCETIEDVGSPVSTDHRRRRALGEGDEKKRKCRLS